MTVRELAETAAKAVMRANAEADLLEAEQRAARERAAEAGKTADNERKVFDREMSRLGRDVEGEIRTLNDRLSRILSSKAPVRPSPELRGLARKFLRMGCEYGEVERLAALDPRFSELFGILTTAQQMPAGMFGRDVRDESLYRAVDVQECRAWRGVLARTAVLAGETES